MGVLKKSPAAEARILLEKISSWKGRSLTFMEVCGTHTMAAARAGMRSLLPPNIRLISGPGCPVCVTPVSYVDHALALAVSPDVTIATFGDLMRVPGSAPASGTAMPPNLLHAKAKGARVEVVYSPLDALRLAREDSLRQVVFLGVGFETTTPTIAATILKAHELGLKNFSVLSAHKTIPEAMAGLAATDELALDGFLCPGHVSVIIGMKAYADLAGRHHLPCVIAGFETIEMLRGLEALVRQAAEDRAEVENCYPGAVDLEGNVRAREIMYRVFEPCDSEWRGLGTIPGSGLKIQDAFQGFDASERFTLELPEAVESRGCCCGDVLRGILDPLECGLFGRKCTPDSPQGACMVSSEGSCAARFIYHEEAER